MYYSQLSQLDSLYPWRLRSIKDPPKCLYYKGTILNNTFDRCLSIVGSRAPTPYGIDVLKYLFKDLDRSLTIVSGFMTGIDYWAHKLALEMGMRTIAVMPCGISAIHPLKHHDLYMAILESHNIIMSEYSGYISPRKWHYVKRNRIIAGLSSATLVVEASLHSGSLITADFCNKYNRNVLVIPGSIFSDKSSGCNRLLNSYGIAVSSSEDIARVLQIQRLFN